MKYNKMRLPISYDRLFITDDLAEACSTCNYFRWDEYDPSCSYLGGDFDGAVICKRGNPMMITDEFFPDEYGCGGHELNRQYEQLRRAEKKTLMDRFKERAALQNGEEMIKYMEEFFPTGNWVLRGSKLREV